MGVCVVSEPGGMVTIEDMAAREPVMPHVHADPSAMICHCMVPSNRLTVGKEGPNKGKEFWVCAKPQGDQCGFFEWVPVDNAAPDKSHSEGLFKDFDTSPGF